jgi:hypothetical protein
MDYRDVSFHVGGRSSYKFIEHFLRQNSDSDIMEADEKET